MSRRSKNVVLVGVLLVAAGLAAALIAVSASGAKDESVPTSVHGVAATEMLLEGIPQRGNVLGNPAAPVTIVEYADYQCPYCARWALDTLPAIVDEYVRPGKARIVFQGIAILGEDSVTALEATVSAGMQDKLWNVGELLFHNQGAENSGWVTDDLLAGNRSLRAGARRRGDDGRSGIGRAIATAIGERASGPPRVAGVTGTPSFEIGTTGGQMTPLQGARPIEEFRQVLNGLLQDRDGAPATGRHRRPGACSESASPAISRISTTRAARPYCIAGGGGCEQVQESEYAKLAGIPVAVLGPHRLRRAARDGSRSRPGNRGSRRRHRPRRSRLQRVVALRTAGTDRCRLPVVRRQRRRHRAGRCSGRLAASENNVDRLSAGAVALWPLIDRIPLGGILPT